MIILLFILLFLTIGGLPAWPCSRGWGLLSARRPRADSSRSDHAIVAWSFVIPAFSFVSALSAAVRFRESASHAFDTVLMWFSS
jgi:hypothetical protein